MLVQDQYPSTHDFPKMAGAQDDPVLGVLRTARDRVQESWTRSHYTTPFGREVCAVGAVFAADGAVPGHTEEPLTQSSVKNQIEELLTESAKEAIRLLNGSAVTMYSWSENYGDWSGPLEAINQRAPLGQAQAMVLEVYDHAIALRAAEPVYA